MKRFFFLFVLLALVAAGCGKGGGKNSGDGGSSDSGGLTKEKYVNYLNKMIAYYQTDEYQQMAAAYKKAAEGVKEIMDRQKIWNKYMTPARDKMIAIIKECGFTTRTLVEMGNKYNKDPKVMSLVFKMAKYVVY